MWDRRAELLNVHDGDTVKVVLDQGFGDTKTINVRLLNVFAPELKQAGGADVRDFVTSWFNQLPLVAWPFIVTTTRLRTADKEDTSFDRYVGVITSSDGTRNLNQDVQAYIHAKGYPGGTGS